MNLKDEGGYSLLEMILTIGLIAIAIGTSTFGLNTVFNSNVNSKANTIVNEIRLTSSRQLGANERVYETIVSYDVSDNRVLFTTYVTDTSIASPTPQNIKTIRLSRGMNLVKDVSGTPTAIESLTLDERTFTFDSSSGALTSGGGGVYTLTSDNSSISRDIVVLTQSGRVYVDE